MKAMAAARFCPYCGQPRAEAWAFCQFCSKALPSAHASDGASGAAAGAGVIDSSSTHDAELWRQAQVHMRKCEYDLAEQDVRALLASHPDHAETVALLGIVCLRRYRLDDAQGLLERAVELAPCSPFVRVRMAEYWLGLGVATRAQGELQQALVCAAEDPVLYEQIRQRSEELRQKTRGSVVRSAALPRMSGLATVFRRASRILPGRPA